MNGWQFEAGDEVAVDKADKRPQRRERDGEADNGGQKTVLVAGQHRLHDYARDHAGEAQDGPNRQVDAPVMITKVWPMARIRNSTAYCRGIEPAGPREQVWLSESRPNTRIISPSTPTIQKSPTGRRRQAKRNVGAVAFGPAWVEPPR